jgi:hypothetical protein
MSYTLTQYQTTPGISRDYVSTFELGSFSANSTSTTDKTVGYVDRSQWVGRWLVRERKEEQRTKPLLYFLSPRSLYYYWSLIILFLIFNQ